MQLRADADRAAGRGQERARGERGPVGLARRQRPLRAEQAGGPAAAATDHRGRGAAVRVAHLNGTPVPATRGGVVTSSSLSLSGTAASDAGRCRCWPSRGAGRRPVGGAVVGDTVAHGLERALSGRGGVTADVGAAGHARRAGRGPHRSEVVRRRGQGADRRRCCLRRRRCHGGGQGEGQRAGRPHRGRAQSVEHEGVRPPCRRSRGAAPVPDRRRGRARSWAGRGTGAVRSRQRPAAGAATGPARRPRPS